MNQMIIMARTECLEFGLPFYFYVRSPEFISIWNWMNSNAEYMYAHYIQTCKVLSEYKLCLCRYLMQHTYLVFNSEFKYSMIT